MPKSIKFNLLRQYAAIYEETISDWGMELQEIKTKDLEFVTEDEFTSDIICLRNSHGEAVRFVIRTPASAKDLAKMKASEELSAERIGCLSFSGRLFATSISKPNWTKEELIERITSDLQQILDDVLDVSELNIVERPSRSFH